LSYEKRQILLIVKAYPEISKRYGNVVCIAGVLEDTNELIRLYPVQLQEISRKGLKKFTRFEARITKNRDEKLKRKESYKIQTNSIKVIDDSLTKVEERNVWEKRVSIIENLLSSSVEDLENSFNIDKTSLGIIKPKIDTVSFKTKKPVEEIEIKIAKSIQKTLFGDKIITPDKIEKTFYYEFDCLNENCIHHKKICVDWELYEAFRNWRKKYSSEDLFVKLKDKFEIFMKQRNLYFILGTHSQFPSWFIIGLFYPPKFKHKKTINDWLNQ